jgi:hypothetical protein
MTAARTAMGVAACAVAWASAAAGAAPRTSGRVEYATAQRLYLDAGERDGLVPGETLQLRRGDKSAGTCRVDAVSDAHATCLGAGKVGDTFALSAAPPLAIPEPERPQQPLSEAETDRRRRVVETAPREKVDFHGTPAARALSGRTEVELTHATWAEQTVGPWHQERLDVAIRGMPLGAGFELYADVSARRYTLRSGSVLARPEDPTQLYVWDAEIARRPTQGGLALAFGRVRPWSAPGSTIIDGAQAGWRTHNNFELGVFGGGVPDPVTLAPSFDRHTAGAYLAMQSVGERDAVIRYSREELRVAYGNSPELGRRVEAEALAQLSLGRMVDFGAQARVARGDREADQSLDGASVDVGFRPFEGLSLLGAFRYQGVSVPERDGPGAALYGGAARHADATLSWEIAPWLTFSGVGGYAKDLTTGLSRRFAGPEIGLPWIFSDVGGASVGVVAEDGWTGGHTAWVQILTRRPRWAQALVRVTWFRTRAMGPDNEDEIGAYASISAQLSPYVALRLSALGRAGGSPGAKPLTSTGSLLGGTAEATLAGRF